MEGSIKGFTEIGIGTGIETVPESPILDTGGTATCPVYMKVNRPKSIGRGEYRVPTLFFK